MHPQGDHVAVFAYKVAMRHKSIPIEVREDVAQETVVRLLECFEKGKVDEKRVSAAFIRTVAYHLFVSRFRKEKRSRPFFDGEDHAAPAIDRFRHRADLLEQAPLILSARQMAILHLRLEGRTHKEIAAELRIPAGTVGRLWAEAMHDLQLALRA
jgi:RNA polymerase sigma factor (sigma-70 family)